MSNSTTPFLGLTGDAQLAVIIVLWLVSAIAFVTCIICVVRCIHLKSDGAVVKNDNSNNNRNNNGSTDSAFDDTVIHEDVTRV